GGALFIFLIPIGLYFLSSFIDNLLNLTNLIPFPLNLIIGIPIIIFGAIWSISANIYIYRHGKGSPIPHESVQTTELVTGGVYKYSRNPMLFGYIVLLLGVGIVLSSLFFIILSNLTITVFVILFIKLKEEKDLLKRFGDSYLEYKRKTSFMIPWIPKKNNK
ncbi:MAG: methyltransferase family protein, partial [Candidatus Helarchaeota archaeon]